MVKLRLIGPFEEVEAITRDLRRVLTIIEEQDYPAKENEHIRRYLTVNPLLDNEPASNP